MKVVAYSIKPFEKEFLAKANQKKHDITLISNSLSIETAAFAEGKDAVVIFTNDDASAPVIDKLAAMGVKYIATRSAGTDQIDKEAAARYGIKLANVPVYSPQAIAEHTVALAMALNRRLTVANEHSHHFDFKLDDLIGFNFYGKTVGLIGLGHIGLATAAIFRGLGCKVIGYDIAPPADEHSIAFKPLDEVLQHADVISLHAPLTPATHHIINAGAIAQMKPGVMIINTSRGGLIDTAATLAGLQSRKIGYLGIDVYENEKGLFFLDHTHDEHKDELLQQLMALPNVIVTPHQAFLTNEALQQIADQTIRNLDAWQQNKCTEHACACANNCKDKKAAQQAVVHIIA